MLIYMQQLELDLNRVVGANVKLRRTDAGWSQAELAERLAAQLGKQKIDPTSITRMESGTRPTTISELQALAAIFGVREDVLMITQPDEARELARVSGEWAVQRSKEVAASLRAEDLWRRAQQMIVANPSILGLLSDVEMKRIEIMHLASDAAQVDYREYSDSGMQYARDQHEDAKLRVRGHDSAT